jgi:Leucine-rich repeat (LRR) protein
LNQIEVLYLNNNNFKQLPVDLKELKNLKYLDIHDNKSKFDIQELQRQGFGFKINF